MGLVAVLIFAAPLVRAEESLGPNLMPSLRHVTVAGDEEKFREDRWTGDGWAGGIDELRFERGLRNQFSLSLDGRAIIPEEDYRFRLKVGAEDMGYFLGEYTEFRKYFDGTGGAYGPFDAPPAELDNDLRLDVGNVLLELGLTHGELPKVAVRYEHKFKEGNKSLLEWGQVTQAGTVRNIFPSFKDIDEETDVVGLEVGHDLGRVQVGDRFHYERYRTETTRFDEDRNLTTGAGETVTVNEDYHHDALYNAFHLESFLREKFYCSMGYLYSRLRGEGGMRITTIPFGPEPFDNNWFTRAVQVDHDSHVLNLNGMLGPFNDFVFYGGIQAETSESKGDTDAVLTETVPVPGTVSPAALIVSDRDAESLEETLGVRFTGIRYTTIYAEGKWAQDRIDLFEREAEDGALAFERMTKTDRDGQRYSLGLNTSPYAGTTFSLRYRRNYRKNDYDNVTDSEAGYSAFITGQDSTKDELSGRLSFRPLSWAHVSLMYQLLSLDADTAFESLPTGSVQSGDYDADVYSMRIVLRPTPKVHLTGLFSYRDAESAAFDNASPSVVAYQGDVLSVLATAGYIIDEQKALSLEYLFSLADNSQDNSSEGLPLGADNRRQGLRLALSRQITDGARTRFEYGYYRYDDRSSAGANDYRAHLFALTFAYSF